MIWLVIDVVETICCLIEVLCMPIEVREMETFEIGSAFFITRLGLNESSMFNEP